MNNTPDRKPTYEELEREVAAARKRIADLEAEVDRVLKRVSELERQGKRQAAPFSKGEPTKEPKKPGRKPGKGHWVRRMPPERIDETLEAPLPAACPCCGDVLQEVEVADQYQTDLPRVVPVNRHFQVHVGVCRGCGQRVQGRHDLQTSDALGAAAVQLGPNALAQAALLNKAYGLSWGKVQALFARAFGFVASKSAFTRATVERLSRLARPLYERLSDEIKTSPIVGADETSWKVAGHLNWLWIFTNATTTIYKIEPSRGWDVVRDTLGEGYSGVLVRDGWAPYRKLTAAKHQTCLAHFFKRIAEILELARRGAARFPRALRRVLKKALALRDHRHEYTEHGFKTVCGRIRRELGALMEWNPSYEPNRRLVKHLRTERDAMLTFLENEGVDAANWRSEQGVRPMVVTRKASGGNRSEDGADAQSTLMSVIRSCAQRGRDAIDLFVRLFRGEDVDLSFGHAAIA